MNGNYDHEKNISCDREAYQNTSLSFLMEGEPVYVGNIVYECFHRSIPLHSHSDNSYEIHYIFAGHGKVTIDGKEYDTLPGVLYITGPFVSHSMVPDREDPLSEYCIYLKLSPGGEGSDKPGSALRIFRNMRFWYGQDGYGIYFLMRTLFSELKERSTGYRIVAESVIKQIMISCVRNYSVSEKNSDQKGIRTADDHFLAIEEAFLYEYATLTLSELSERLNLSNRQTQRLLREHYGTNFQSKKTEARMNAAAMMLSQPDKTVTQIADDLGYSSVEHFAAAFKKYYGMSTGNYRKTVIALKNRQTG